MNKKQDLKTAGVIAEKYGMTTIMFNRLLWELHIQEEDGKTWKLCKQYRKRGYTEVRHFDHRSGRSYDILLWTKRGEMFLYHFLKMRGILPLSEQRERS